jgi:hypothetical protein
MWISVGPLGADDRTLTIAKSKGVTRCWTGCFGGTKDEFLAAVETKHGDSVFGRGYRAALAFAESQFALIESKK